MNTNHLFAMFVAGFAAGLILAFVEKTWPTIGIGKV